MNKKVHFMKMVGGLAPPLPPPPSHPFFYALASYNKCFARKSLCKFHEVSCPLK